MDYRTSHATPGYGSIYERTYSSGYYYFQWHDLERPMLERLFEELRSKGCKTCLDFACGTGRITSIAQRYFSVTGVDVSSEMLAEAEKRVHNAKLVRLDLTKQSLGEKFDVCTSFRFFLNAGDELRNDALTAIGDHLNPGGTLIANVHVNSHSILGLAYRLRNRMSGRVLANVLDLDSFVALLHRHGFSVEAVHWYSFLPRIGWHFPWLARHGLRSMDSVFNRLPRSMQEWAQAFVVVASKC